MRWLILALPVVLLSTVAALSVSLFVVPDSALSERSQESAGRAQYADEDQGGQVEPPGGPPPTSVEGPEPEYSAGYTRWLAHESDALEVRSPESGSEGTLAGGHAPAEELAVMQPPAPYSQVVDNASPGGISEPGWSRGTGESQYYGEDYSYVEPSEAGAPARFKVEIPTTDHYTVYARWPDLKGNNPATRFGVSTTSGIKWLKVDQRRDGGMWVRLGAYEMEAGERYGVQVSAYRAKGRVVADAVMVVRGTQVSPPGTDTGGQARAEDVVQRARNHIGTPYVHSPPGSCEPHHAEDCSCLTSLVYGKWLEMPDHPAEQWAYGREVEKTDLRPGDLVFFKEAGGSNPITHVAIYSGEGNIIHSSSYWGGVVERPMEYV
ncbi:MAG: NlpC/P60 family protein, partial [Actinomycetota bacterium]|nr:NlpC/P60 family protein [Actinomycetota bacterium]